MTTTSLAGHLWSLPHAAERGYREAFFTTFNVDPAFFASRVLGSARSAGAAVTVVADASVFGAQTRAMMGAGTAYHLGLVAHRAAFHPKVSVLAGPERALVAVGSGNLTAGGWLANDETLTVAYADETGVPSLVLDVALWLRTLEDLSLGDVGKAAARRTADLLDGLVAQYPSVATPHRLVSSATRPIIEQLPAGPIEELRVFAPFHDPRATALDELLDRFGPSRVHRAVQDDFTIIDPEQAARVAADRGVDVVWHRTGEASGSTSGSVHRRYRHGKLIEALNGEHRWTLTGSPNLTSAALLRSVGEGGNVEVGVVHVGGHSTLFPGGEVVDRSQLRPAPPIRVHGEGLGEGTTVPRAEIIEAAISGEALDVTLGQAAPTDLVLEVLSLRPGASEEFSALCDVPRAQCRLTVDELDDRVLAGDLVRLAWDSPGGRLWSAAVPVSGRAEVLHRLGSPRLARRNSSQSWRDLFDEESLGEWLRVALAVAHERPPAPARTTVADKPERSDERPTVDRLSVDDDAWAYYIDDVEARLGRSIAEFGAGRGTLPLPGLPGSGGRPLWAGDRFDDSAEADEAAEEVPSGAVGDEAAESSDAQREGHAASALKRASPQVRRRFRDYLTRLVAAFDELGPVERNAAARLVLTATWAGAWDDDDDWFPILADALTRAIEGAVDRLRPITGSIVALGMYRLERVAAPDVRVGTGRLFAHLSDIARALLEDLDEQTLEDVCQDLPPTWGVEAALVMELVRAICDPDEWSELIRKLVTEYPDWEVSSESSSVLAVSGPFSNPLRIAAQVLEQVPVGPRAVAVRASADSGQSVVAIRAGDVLAVRAMLGKRFAWKTYRLAGLVSPMTLVENAEMGFGSRIDPAPWMAASDVVVRACAAVGLDLHGSSGPLHEQV